MKKEKWHGEEFFDLLKPVSWLGIVGCQHIDDNSDEAKEGIKDRKVLAHVTLEELVDLQPEGQFVLLDIRVLSFEEHGCDARILYSK